MIHILLGVLLAPLLPGLINRTKAFFAGRSGPPVLQLYYDLNRLLRKSAVYSKTTSWPFRLGPSIGCAAMLVCLALVPWAHLPSFVAFEGDFLLLAYLFAVARFFMVLAALDTGSSFEGMGASREVQFALLAEPALILALGALSRRAGSLSLSSMLGSVDGGAWTHSGVVLGLIAAALLIVLLTENSRIPVDDPNTHLELTMIHEVMVLDYSGPDLAFIEYAASLKLWLTSVSPK
jgi:formate hydrogenlyase subunit 4